MFTGIYYGEARLKCSGSCLSFHEDIEEIIVSGATNELTLLTDIKVKTG